MTGELRTFRRRRLTPEEGRDAACVVLEMPIADRLEKGSELHLDDPETLLPLLDTLRQRGPSVPAAVLEEATFLYEFLESLQPRYPIDAFLLDEREYFLGETARLAGVVSRELSRREEARRWLDLAEGWFLLTENASGNLSRVTYQRLALRTEERDFARVLELLPQLISSFQRLGMTEDALKARFLEAAALKETDRLAAAIEVFREIVSEAESLRNDNLLSLGYVNLVQSYAYLGESEKALGLAAEAAPILQRVGNRIGLAKLRWGVGYLLRSNGDLQSAMEAYRAAQHEFGEIGMHADVAAVHLVVADLLLDANQEKQAEWEIRQALPIIDEYKLVPEGFAALSLLRESLRRQTIDRQALRNLHGYFEELSS